MFIGEGERGDARSIFYSISLLAEEGHWSANVSCVQGNGELSRWKIYGGNYGFHEVLQQAAPCCMRVPIQASMIHLQAALRY